MSIIMCKKGVSWFSSCSLLIDVPDRFDNLGPVAHHLWWDSVVQKQLTKDRLDSIFADVREIGINE